MFRQYRKIERNEHIVVGCDTSMGLSDYCTAQFLSKTHLDVPLVYHEKIIASEMTRKLYPVLERIYDQTGVKPTIAYERNNGGAFEMDSLAVLNKLGKFSIFRMPNRGGVENPDPTKLGWDTNTGTRPVMLQELKDAIDKRVLRLYDKPTIDELYSFIISRTTATEKAQAEKGAHDDLVMALAIAWQLHQHILTPQIIRPEDLPAFKPRDNVIGI